MSKKKVDWNIIGHFSSWNFCLIILLNAFLLSNVVSVSAVNSVRWTIPGRQRPAGNRRFRSRGHVYAPRPEKGEELHWNEPWPHQHHMLVGFISVVRVNHPRYQLQTQLDNSFSLCVRKEKQNKPVLFVRMCMELAPRFN